MSWVCKCTRGFKTSRALMVHSNTCKGFYKYKQHLISTTINETIPYKDKEPFLNNIQYCEESNKENESFPFESDIADEEELDVDDEILKQAYEHNMSGFTSSKAIDPEYISGIILLSLLKKAKCPIYLFDQIVDWARSSHITYQIDFNSTKLSRKSCIDHINTKFDLKGIRPQTTTIICSGSKQEVNVVWHDFKQCLYSLLMDDELMQESNLLPEEDISKEIDDVNSGSVWKNAQTFYINDIETEKLIPIIFFTDKTHTDIHGRLCLEPVQFTLGVFNRNTRNNPKAWRTIGYVTEVIYSGKITTEMKQQDYHDILSVILQSFKECQSKCLKWIFRHKDDSKEYILKIPVLYIIGDTEGHDKLCGRFMNRQTIPYLCRYCDIHRDYIDDPFVDSNLTKMKDIVKLVKKKDRTSLNGMSMHLINNAWHDVQFCDTKQGLHGSTLAELLHSMQQGMFEYTIKQLFSSKKQKGSKKKSNRNQQEDTLKCNKRGKKRNREDEEYVAPDDSELGNYNVFSKGYEERFENLCKKYGKILQHQSDRNLPRTFFNSRYMTITRKNGHEMAGLILVYLMIFSSTEGIETIDRELGTDRCGAYIHVFELLLMMESFCKQDVHTKNHLIIANKGIPMVMNTIKGVLNRTEGCGMKIIKFHLMKHFASDIFRFGSMKNFDSAIGERNHCTEVKDPAKHTQRRKSLFEYQTAKRYVENLAISIAYSSINHSDEKQSKSDNENKHSNIIYIHEKKAMFKRDWKDSKLVKVAWKDKILLEDLVNMCSTLVENGSLESPINFFTQHNRNETIFRGEPEWKDTKEPWYDWAQVKWDGYEYEIPAQIQIFMDLSSNFKKTFQVGQSFVTEPGYYAIARTFQDVSTEKAHGESKIVYFGELVYDAATNRPQMCMFSVDSICNSMVAVPYNTNEEIFNAKEWLIIKPKSQWYTTLINHLQEELSKSG